MNIRLALLAAALAAISAPAFAGDNTIEVLSKQTGVSERHVRMIIGNRTPYPEYAYTYARVLKKFKAGIGNDNYERLMSGQTVLLPSGERVNIRVASVR
jgi:hypothetical protein